VAATVEVVTGAEEEAEVVTAEAARVGAARVEVAMAVEMEEVATVVVMVVEAMEVGWVAVVMAGEAMEAGSAEVMEEG
jgi:hypothetical protein